MSSFDLGDYFGAVPDVKQRHRTVAVEAALEILKAEAQSQNGRINYTANENLVEIYADQIEKALEVEDE